MWLGYGLKRTAGTYWAGQPRPDCSYKLSCSNYLDDSVKTIPSPKSLSYFLCKKSLVQAKSVLVKKHTCQEGKRAGSWSVIQVIQETVFFTWFTALFFTQFNSLKQFRREIFWFGFVSCNFYHAEFFEFSTISYCFKKCNNKQDSQYLLWRLHRKIEWVIDI